MGTSSSGPLEEKRKSIFSSSIWGKRLLQFSLKDLLSISFFFSDWELQVEQSQLGKERQALENALAKAQLCEEREQENNQLLSQLKLLQVEYFSPNCIRSSTPFPFKELILAR